MGDFKYRPIFKLTPLLYRKSVLFVIDKNEENEKDSVVVGIVGMCMTGYLTESWVTLFAGFGKAALCFSMRCEQRYP